MADSLDALACALAMTRERSMAVRLVGAVNAAREKWGCVRPTHDRQRVEALLGCTSTADTDVQQWLLEGSALSLEEAASLGTRGRGRKTRPVTGWDSLTPAERDVVRLVAEGLSNPEIGERLFISRRTVQSHLTRVFGKLGLSSRQHLTAEAVRHGVLAGAE